MRCRVASGIQSRAPMRMNDSNLSVVHIEADAEWNGALPESQKSWDSAPCGLNTESSDSKASSPHTWLF